MIDVNVSGRLMLLLTRHGVLDNRCLRVYQRAVSAVIRQRLAGEDGLAGMAPLLEEQLALLDVALQRRASRRPAAGQDAEVVAEAAAPDDEVERQPDTAPREPRQASGYVPPVKSMEEKLKDARTPVQTLLREDCVHVGLIDAKGAEKLILGMTGKTSEQAERDIVEQLRQILQDQVKGFIRKARGGPWGDPRAQEDLRKDIHAARSVRSVLMLGRQVSKEYQVWQKEHQHGGILGLFGPRRRIVDRR